MTDTEFIDDMRTYRLDRLMDGWPAVRTAQIDRLIAIIDRQAAEYRETAERCALIAYTTEPPKSIGQQMGQHHSAGAQHAAKRIREEFHLSG